MHYFKDGGFETIMKFKVIVHLLCFTCKISSIMVVWYALVAAGKKH